MECLNQRGIFICTNTVYIGLSFLCQFFNYFITTLKTSMTEKYTYYIVHCLKELFFSLTLNIKCMQIQYNTLHRYSNYRKHCSLHIRCLQLLYWIVICPIYPIQYTCLRLVYLFMWYHLVFNTQHGFIYYR